VILADTSVWIEHLRATDPRLSALLDREQLVMHPFVVGELALGSFRNPERILSNAEELPSIAVATDGEVLQFIRHNSLSGTGIGYVDAHLLVAARLTPRTSLWTFDRRLHAVADRLGLAFEP
jgi:predicted nucleic acid-binding protein